ncbi:F-box domain-containing protein [Entamoeba marina]
MFNLPLIFNSNLLTLFPGIISFHGNPNHLSSVLTTQNPNYSFEICIDSVSDITVLSSLPSLSSILSLTVNAPIDVRCVLYRMNQLKKLKYVGGCQVVPFAELPTLEFVCIKQFNITNAQHLKNLEYSLIQRQHIYARNITRKILYTTSTSEESYLKLKKVLPSDFIIVLDNPNNVLSENMLKTVINGYTYLSNQYNSNGLLFGIEDFTSPLLLLINDLYLSKIFIQNMNHSSSIPNFIYSIIIRGCLGKITSFINLYSLEIYIDLIQHHQTLNLLNCTHLFYFELHSKEKWKSSIQLPSSIKRVALSNVYSTITISKQPIIDKVTIKSGILQNELIQYSKHLRLVNLPITYLSLPNSIWLFEGVSLKHLKHIDKNENTKVVLTSCNSSHQLFM